MTRIYFSGENALFPEKWIFSNNLLVGILVDTRPGKSRFTWPLAQRNVVHQGTPTHMGHLAIFLAERRSTKRRPHSPTRLSVRPSTQIRNNRPTRLRRRWNAIHSRHCAHYMTDATIVIFSDLSLWQINIRCDTELKEKRSRPKSACKHETK